MMALGEGLGLSHKLCPAAHVALALSPSVDEQNRTVMPIACTTYTSSASMIGVDCQTEELHYV